MSPQLLKNLIRGQASRRVSIISCVLHPLKGNRRREATHDLSGRTAQSALCAEKARKGSSKSSEPPLALSTLASGGKGSRRPMEAEVHEGFRGDPPVLSAAGGEVGFCFSDVFVLGFFVVLKVTLTSEDFFPPTLLASWLWRGRGAGCGF